MIFYFCQKKNERKLKKLHKLILGMSELFFSGLFYFYSIKNEFSIHFFIFLLEICDKISLQNIGLFFSKLFKCMIHMKYMTCRMPVIYFTSIFWWKIFFSREISRDLQYSESASRFWLVEICKYDVALSLTSKIVKNKKHD